jgi:putative protein kinase ArgK-like GTPase of G3E family
MQQPAGPGGNAARHGATGLPGAGRSFYSIVARRPYL